MDITHPSLLIGIVANELEGDVVLDPLLNRHFVELADFTDQLENCGITKAGADVIQSGVYLYVIMYIHIVYNYVQYIHVRVWTINYTYLFLSMCGKQHE